MDHTFPPPPRRLVVELIGPAAAGKSEMSRVLQDRGHARRAGIWDVPQGSLLLEGVVLLPAWLGACLHARACLWKEYKHIARIDAFPQVLDRLPGGHQPIVLDEGPIFALTWLRLFGHRDLTIGDPGTWWARTLRYWARVIDAIVMLDAPDSVLIQRIRSRAKSHAMKSRSDCEIMEFTARFRSAYQDVLLELSRERPIAQLSLPTGESSPAQLADTLLAHVEGTCRDH